MQWNAETIRELKVGAVGRDHSRPVSSLDVSFDGELCVSTDAQRLMRLWDCLTAKLRGTIPSQKYGCSIARFTHDRNYMLVADDYTSGSKAAPTVRLLNLAKETYQHYFSPHQLQVTHIAMSPRENEFISVDQAGTVRIFDVRGPNANAELRMPAQQGDSQHCTTRAEYSADGLVYAVCCMDNLAVYLKLFDPRSVKGPFATYLMKEYDRVADSMSLSFNDCVTAHRTESQTELRVTDTFKFRCKNIMPVEQGPSTSVPDGHRTEVQFAPRGPYVAAGGFDGTLKIWDSESAELLLNAKVHPLPLGCIRWNPRYGMMITACQNLAFWLSS